MRGLGGAGARGYLVRRRDEDGDVGDFRFAGEMSPAEMAPEPLLCVLVDWVLRCFLCLRLSSWCSFIRIDLLAGAISSEPCNDLDLVCRFELPRFSSLMERSDSDPDDNPDEEELDWETLDALVEARRPPEGFPLLFPPTGVSLSRDGMPRT